MACRGAVEVEMKMWGTRYDDMLVMITQSSNEMRSFLMSTFCYFKTL